MQVASTGKSDIVGIENDAMALGIYADGPLSTLARAVDAATGGLVGKLQSQKEFAGKPNELLAIPSPVGLKTRLLLLVGLGEAAKLDAGGAYRAAAAAALALASKESAKRSSSPSIPPGRPNGSKAPWPE